MKIQNFLLASSLIFSFSAFAKDNSSEYAVLAKKQPIALYNSAQKKNSFEGCERLFPNNNSNDVVGLYTDHNGLWRFRKLCSDNFAVLYSDRTKTPILVVEKLNAASLNKRKKGLERTDIFYTDPRTPTNGQAKASDYKNANPGVDKGHLAPAGNALTEKGMAQTFAMSNMIPQDSNNNRQAWNKIETDVRKYITRSKGDTYILTGVLFDKNEKSTVKLGKNQVWKPTRLFKLVYNTDENRSWVYLVDNAPTTVPKPISYPEFVKKTKLQFNFLDSNEPVPATNEILTNGSSNDTASNNGGHESAQDKFFTLILHQVSEFLKNMLQAFISKILN
ncbi:DNA/RNA non-specific endonuclease [Acinetobacter equi]|uniref:Endonuclease n=1 Tax=Acinetobacter equi TaxID=1324350 RepID=A0A0N9WC54_9GAMM|nr:DNA/RNA non-specific endonuclease [Acinetobacter equi]ALH94950.1 hypothetical protein AOY20_05035 [Acinetobacter equi]